VRQTLNLTGAAPAAPIATDGGRTTTTTGTPTSRLAVTRIHADASGDDFQNLNDEYVVLKNTGTQPLDLSQWTLQDEAGHTYTFPSRFTLAPEARVTIHTGHGTNTASDLYWGSSVPIWNNGGDTIRIMNAEGQPVLTESY